MSELQAGRELDALVAEKVMGWHVIETDDCNGEDNFWLSKDGQNVWRDKHWGERALPAYSTDIAAAWEVVEKLPQRFSLEINGQEFSATWYKTRPYAPWDFMIVARAVAETAPLAICRAALKAVEQ